MKMEGRMTIQTALALTIAVLLFVPAVNAVAGEKNEMETVPEVDLGRYLGKWYEIARFDAWFQKGCENSTAEYSLRKDGDIKVVNSCMKGGKDGKISVSEGKAWVVDNRTNAKLKVRFFWPFSGNYWVIELGKDYEYSVVSEPGRKYLWVLSRTPVMDAKLFEGIVERRKAEGFDMTNLLVNPGSVDKGDVPSGQGEKK